VDVRSGAWLLVVDPTIFAEMTEVIE